ncbi:DUF1707 domain-containing protein [Solirubrobacter phytolaccae]|uniref:DUF1707 domain-containing protein n=1 Tax=Solirubrobacter phytolaccae TaxID=1404360 RepID=A0A9X3N505_9ACTN|nr:DUF1707 domain-containing protein [Solirubrobacter phytolaccae]MDA0179596.1 DUF1707 domain-containing protein [Solirubrobacter phytolaccae]
MSWQRPYSELRASDSERERVVEFLREHALVGRLNHDELEERIGLAYAAIYRGDLERLIGDLPRRDQPVARRSRPDQARAVVHKRNEPKPFMVLVGMSAIAIPMIVLTGAIIALAVVVMMSALIVPLLIVALLIAHGAKRRRMHHRPHGGGMAGGFS